MLMEKINNIKSMYIHIPFCRNICSYCDFCKFYYYENLVDQYLDALLSEIDERYAGEELETIYIGGGTPSCLSISQLEKLFSKIDTFSFSNNYEFTIECNIMDITEEKLIFFKNHKVNRLSIGVESFQESILEVLERDYRKQDIFDRVNLAKEYFSNINIDLIYAVSGENLSDLEKDIELFLKLDVNHISTYSLMIEDNTKLGIKGVLPISEELDKKMYDMIHKTLTDYDFNHYEISNFSKLGYESKHNLVYWQNKHYYGFGLGASGYIGNIRYTNTRNIKKYLSLNYVQDQEIVSKELDATNQVILGLRTIYGVDDSCFIEKFGSSFIDYFKVGNLVNDKILLKNGNSFYINPEYWYVSNEILIKFV